MNTKPKPARVIFGLLMAGMVPLPAANPQSSRVQAGVERPAGLVPGGAFIDLIQPIPVDGGLVADCWGGDNVKPRVVSNGIEDPAWSYWCASHIKGPDGLEHLFTVRWPQEKGHKHWVRSQLVHAVAEKPTGPYRVVEELGPGHNADVHQAKDGTYVVSVTGRSYLSKDLKGPWRPVPTEFDVKEPSMSNKTFVRREDGSFLMVLRSGSIWLSNDGLQPYRRIYPTSVYPFSLARGSTAFEDPVVWRDEVQYHMMVNNWPMRTAFYGRSPDGLHWTWEPGTAFDNRVVRHPDGTVEEWHKVERPRVCQDEFGRATHLILAVIDCPKEQCDGTNDSSSKAVLIPLTVGKRLKILNDRPIDSGTREIRVEIKSEPGFDPAKDVDLESLRFGAPEEVNFGRGCRARASAAAGGNLLVTFDAAGHGLKEGEHAAKLLGRTRDGRLLFGHARVPGVAVHQRMLVARMPRLARKADGALAVSIPVENAAVIWLMQDSLVRVSIREPKQGKEPGKELQHGLLPVPNLKPYGTRDLEWRVPAASAPAGGVFDIEVAIRPGSPTQDTFAFRKITLP